MTIDKNQVSFGSLDARDEVKPCIQPKGTSNCHPDLCFKSYRRDPLARLITDRLGLTPFQFALIMIGMTALLYALATALYAVFYPSGVAGDFLLWSRRSWAQLMWLLIPPLIMGFYCWINRATGCLFDRLIRDDIVEASDEELRDIVMSRKGSIQEAYNGSAWTIASILVLVLAVVLSVVRPGFRQAVGAIGSDIVLFDVVMLPFLALQIYTVSMMVAKEVITIRSLGKFFGQTTLNLRPLHPDRCGGLRSLQDYAMTVNYLIAVVGLGLYLLSYLSFQAGHLATNYLLHFFLGCYLITAPYCFFASLGTAHKAMKSAKESFLRNISEQFQSAYAETQERLTAKHGDLKDSLDTIQQLQTFHKLTQSFPVWPFDVRSIRRFVITIMAPLAWTTVAAIIDRLL